MIRTVAVLFGAPPSLESVFGVLASGALELERCEMRKELVEVETTAGLVEATVYGAPWPDEDAESLGDLGGAAAGLYPGSLARAGAQDALWPGGERAAYAHRSFALFRVTEATGSPKSQMETLEKLGVALLAHPDALCVYFPAGESLRDGNIIGQIRASAREQGALPLQIWVNGRVADAGMGVHVADVVGLAQLGLADAEAVFPESARFSPYEVLGFLLDVTHHLVLEGGALEEGVIFEGPGGGEWRAGLGADAQIAPARKLVRWIPITRSDA